MPVSVSTTQFEFSHGRKPRGTGTWWFFFAGHRYGYAKAECFAGSYSSAKAAAVREAKRVGYTKVEVGS